MTPVPVLRTSRRDVEAWREQPACLAETAERPDITLQVLPCRAGPHGLMNTAVKFLRLPNGRVVACRENATCAASGGECVEVVAPDLPSLVPVRGSEEPSRGALLFTAPAWAAFVGGVRREAGEGAA